MPTTKQINQSADKFMNTFMNRKQLYKEVCMNKTLNQQTGKKTEADKNKAKSY